MKIQAYRLNLECEISLVMAYIADEPVMDLAKRIPTWPEDIGVLKGEHFNDFESLIQSGACDELILVAPELKPEEEEVVDQLAARMTDYIAVLLCNGEPGHNNMKHVGTVISTQDNLVSAMFDLAWAMVTSFTGRGLVGVDLADVNSILWTSKKGMMNTFNHEESVNDYKTMASKAVDTWPSEAMGGRRIAGMLTSFSIRPGDPFYKGWYKFLSLMEEHLPECSFISGAAMKAEGYQSKDMLQLIMLSDE